MVKIKNNKTYRICVDCWNVHYNVQKKLKTEEYNEQ